MDRHRNPLFIPMPALSTSRRLRHRKPSFITMPALSTSRPLRLSTSFVDRCPVPKRAPISLEGLHEANVASAEQAELTEVDRLLRKKIAELEDTGAKDKKLISNLRHKIAELEEVISNLSDKNIVELEAARVEDKKVISNLKEDVAILKRINVEAMKLHPDSGSS